MICWTAFKSDGLTVFTPASVMADTAKKRKPTKGTLWAGADIA
jgi:hypothetical protein